VIDLKLCAAANGEGHADIAPTSTMQTRSTTKRLIATTAVAASTELAPSHAVHRQVAITPSPTPSQKKRRVPPRSPVVPVVFANRSCDTRVPCDELRREMRALVAADPEGDTKTLSGWCLVDALTHCCCANDGKLLPLIRKAGPPTHFLGGEENMIGDGNDSFRSLCRTVIAQLLADKAARTIHSKLLDVVGSSSNLTPSNIVAIAARGDVENELRKPVGLSNAKCNCILKLAELFQSGTLSDDLLLKTSDESAVRERLIQVKGIGQWTVDMFMLFSRHSPNVFPIGDLAFRRGTKKVFGIKGSAKGGELCPKKDLQKILDAHAPFHPYRSISAYYMYKAQDLAEDGSGDM